MIVSKEIEISSDENAGELHDKLMSLGSEAVVATLALIENGKVKTTQQQDNAEIKTAYKLNRENCKIDWSNPAAEIHNLIRGLSPYPSAWCFFKDNGEEWNVKIYEAKIISENHIFNVGQIIATKKEIKIAVKDGFIQILSLQLPGKKKMQANELLNGVAFSEKAQAE
jgi:methionyl-tRNA formyltransferase